MPRPKRPGGPRRPLTAPTAAPTRTGAPALYGPHAPHTPYAPPTPTNPFAIASLLTGILCCLPGVGLLLGVVALVQIRKRGQRGRAAAAIGSALSGIGLGLAVLLLTTGATG
ncbi:DUF4190 domain-containing protein [Streptomyces bauhiniae]|uniref:DUF4190 domain-containing protein n=1 Tax=Streptomyces bauhiniae TaxID=2340725 RepID=UPI00381228EE